MGKCTILAHVKTSKGSIVESKLFKDLLHYTSDRSLAKEFYAVGTDKEFLSKVADKAEFDENGEITFKSLKNLADINLEEERIKSILTKDLNSGVYEYNEAIPRLASFNRNNPYNDKYMATIEVRNDGKVELRVVERNTKNESDLNNVIANRSLRDRIKYYLNLAGADYTFLDKDSKINGRYSTLRAEQNAQSLWQLIKVANNEKFDESLSEEAGHFAVGALGNNPLVQRLINSVSDENVQRSIFGDEYDVIASRANPAREAAGYLVGQAINGNIDQQSRFYSLTSRILNLIKRIFYKIKGDDVSLAILKAKENADNVAKGFMSDVFEGSVNQALETKETLYSAPSSNNVRVFRKIANILKLQTDEIRNANKKEWSKYYQLEAKVTAGRLEDKPGVFGDTIAVDGIVEAVDLIAEKIPEMIQKLGGIDFNSTDITPENSNTIMEVRIFVNNALAILKIIDDCTHEKSVNKLTTTEELNDKLKALSTTLHESISGPNRLLATLVQVEKSYACKYLEDVLGSSYVHRAARMVFNWKGKIKDDTGKSKSFVTSIDATDIPIVDLLTQLDTDITWFERHLASMSNNSDIIGQLYDRTVKFAKSIANSTVLNYQDRLRLLQKEAEAKGVKDTKVICEISERTGMLTGNIVSEYCRGDWEDDFLEFKKHWQEEFKRKYPNLKGKSNSEKATLWAMMFEPELKVWHKAHSKFNKTTNSWEPNDTYLSTQFKNLSSDEKEVLKKYMNLKQEIDSMLAGNGVSYRMPQFKGTTTNKIRNKRLFQSTGKAVLNTLRSNLADTFLEDSEDTEFGSQLTYNTIDEDMFSDQLSEERERLSRIPLYGINKLKDPSLLSTDLYHSTLAYAGMASNYAAMSSVSGVLEVGMNVLKERNVGGLKSEGTRTETSRAFTRLSKFMDSNVYSIHTPKVKIGKRLILNKLVNFFSGMASKVFLGGNVVGGAANITMGATEIFKEALSGEFFNVKDWEKAHKQYWKDLPSNWLHAGDDVKEDKTSLFIRYFDILNKNQEESRDWFTRKKKFVKLNPLGENLFLPYKVGEHYMQSMAYLSIANNTKLIDSYGNPISLFDAYEVAYIDDTKPEAGKTLRLKKGIRVKDDDGSVRYWTEDDEAKFMDKVREINNRMHGIYNNLDKVAFQRTIFGGAFMAMRGYALGMVQRRFGASNYSVTLEQDTEGSYRSLMKVLANITETPALTMRAIFLPVSDKVKQEMLNAGYSANQYYNMRRNFGDMLFIAASFLLKLLTAKPDDDDEEDTNIAMGISYYFASRLFTEQSAFNTPWGMVKESKPLLNVLPAGASVTLNIMDIAYYMALDVIGDEGAYYKSSGSTYTKGETKWKHKVERLLPFYRSYLLLQTPYQAAQSYQYGRVTGGIR